MPLVPYGQMILLWKILQTHILKYDQLKYKKGKEGRSRIWIFFLREGGERLGLVVEEEDERLGLALVMSVYDYTSPSVEEFRARLARTRLYCTVCVVLGQFLSSGKGSGLRICLRLHILISRGVPS
jgi:hypothetical protein